MTDSGWAAFAGAPALIGRTRRAEVGVIIGESHDGSCWRVLFDGHRDSNITSAHKSLVELTDTIAVRPPAC